MNQAQPPGGILESSVLSSDSRTANRKTKKPSCDRCKKQKIKCDRIDPCSHCTRVRAPCVYSLPSGAPRGRQGGRRRKIDNELLNRIARLESLVKSIDGEERPDFQPVDHLLVRVIDFVIVLDG